jgi:hypothetical protein
MSPQSSLLAGLFLCLAALARAEGADHAPLLDESYFLDDLPKSAYLRLSFENEAIASNPHTNNHWRQRFHRDTPAFRDVPRARRDPRLFINPANVPCH